MSTTQDFERDESRAQNPPTGSPSPERFGRQGDHASLDEAIGLEGTGDSVNMDGTSIIDYEDYDDYEDDGGHPDEFWKPAKIINEAVLVSEDRSRYKKPVALVCEGAQPESTKRRLDLAAISRAIDLPEQSLMWLREDRVAANKLSDHEWFEDRRHKESSNTQQSEGPTFEDILMEDVPLPTELSVKREDLPPPPQPAGGGASVGPQTWRLNEVDLLHAGPFVPKSIWGFFQKALCAKPRK